MTEDQWQHIEARAGADSTWEPYPEEAIHDARTLLAYARQLRADLLTTKAQRDLHYENYGMVLGRILNEECTCTSHWERYGAQFRRWLEVGERSDSVPWKTPDEPGDYAPVLRAVLDERAEEEAAYYRKEYESD